MKTTTSSDNPKAFHRLQELVRDIDVAMVTTVTPDGALRSRPMVTVKFDDEGRIWFFTADDSGKATDIAQEHGVNVSYADGRKHHFVSVTGNATVRHDREKAKALWKNPLKAYFPRGLDDPHLALLEVRIDYAEYWDSESGRMVRFLTGKRSTFEGEHDDHHVRVDVRATPTSG